MILITGANGVLGKNLYRYLIENGVHSIKLLDINRSSSYDNIPQEYILYDITRSDAPRDFFSNVDTVVHCASAAPSYSRKDISKIVIDGTRNLLENSYKNNIKKFIYISSTAVYGIPKKVPVLEIDELQDFHDPYNRAKIAAEKICRNYREKGMCIPILRPRTFIGPERLGTFALLYDWAVSGKKFPIIGLGENRYQFLDVEDLCQAICLCINKESNIVNQEFNIGARVFGTIAEDYQSVLDRAGYGKKIVRIPASPALAILSVLESLKLIPLYKRLYQKMVLDYYVSIDKAVNELGFDPCFSNAQTLVRGFDWYKENSYKFKNLSGSANNVPWQQGIIALVKPFF